MPFRFKLAEPFEDALRRIGREQIERAQSQFKGAADPISAVHETRKSLKRLRALLHLVRPAIGDETYRAENARLREVGRMLSSTRDRHVLLETITKLDKFPTISRKGLTHAVREALDSANGAESQTVEAATMKQALGLLGEAGRRFGRLRLNGRDFEVVGAGLEASYRKGRRAFRRAYVERTDEAFHEWRKDTQRHWRHMMLLSRAWSECMSARAAAARELSQVLGDDHDLALLSAFVHSQRASGMGEEAAGNIKRLALQRQRELRALAEPMGDRLFAEGARGLHRRIAAYWEAAVALKEHEPEEEAAGAKKLTRSGPRRRRAAVARP
jgi:CHAD domain-containing protein